MTDTFDPRLPWRAWCDGAPLGDDRTMIEAMRRAGDGHLHPADEVHRKIENRDSGEVIEFFGQAKGWVITHSAARGQKLVERRARRQMPTVAPSDPASPNFRRDIYG